MKTFQFPNDVMLKEFLMRIQARQKETFHSVLDDILQRIKRHVIYAPGVRRFRIKKQKTSSIDFCFRQTMIPNVA